MEKLLTALGVSIANIGLKRVDAQMGLTEPFKNSRDIVNTALFAVGAVDYVTGLVGGRVGEALILSTMPLVADAVDRFVSSTITKGYTPAFNATRVTVSPPPTPAPAPAPAPAKTAPAAAAISF